MNKWYGMEFKPYFEGNDKFQEEFDTYKAMLHVCTDNGFMKFFPEPNQTLLNQFYQSYMRGEFEPLPVNEYSTEVVQVALSVISFLESIDEKCKPKTMFDVGCGFGGFVWAMQQIGIEAWGNELNLKWVKDAHQYCSEKIIYGDATDVLDSINKKFDLFFISHVLEHLIDPIQLLKKVRENLSENGTIYINVPNGRSDRFKKLGRRSGIDYENFPQHLNFFTPRSIVDFAEKTGLKIISLTTRPLDEIAPIPYSGNEPKFDIKMEGGEIFALLCRDDSNIETINGEILKIKLKHAEKNVPKLYMHSTSRIRRFFKLV